MEPSRSKHALHLVPVENRRAPRLRGLAALRFDGYEHGLEALWQVFGVQFHRGIRGDGNVDLAEHATLPDEPECVAETTAERLEVGDCEVEAAAISGEEEGPPGLRLWRLTPDRTQPTYPGSRSRDNGERSEPL